MVDWAARDRDLQLVGDDALILNLVETQSIIIGDISFELALNIYLISLPYVPVNH